VRTQPLEFNTAAQNGVWHAYRLANRDRLVTGWFAAHADVDAYAEVEKILRVSGHPGEVDSGSSYNNADTAAQGVLVLNRYDWGAYDKRSLNEVQPDTPAETGSGSEDDSSDEWAMSEAAGLVDYASARPAVLEWKQQPSSERGATDGGVWMHIPNAEYMYGRFGFDDDHAAARSFLFFHSGTRFVGTTFAGRQEALKKSETPREMFERRLQEGFDFSGRAWLRRTLPPANPDPNVPYNPPPPAIAQRTRAYGRDEHVLSVEDVTRALEQQEGDIRHWVDGGLRPWTGELSADALPRLESWREAVCDLVNDMLLGHLQLNVARHVRNRGLQDAAQALYPAPSHGARSPLDNMCYRQFMGESAARQIAGVDTAGVGARVKAFLRRIEGPDAVFQDECVDGITRVLVLLVAEVLELAGNASVDLSDYRIMPRGVRVAVFNDPELFALFKFSSAFWEVIDEP
jgi:hypothetical protein